MDFKIRIFILRLMFVAVTVFSVGLNSKESDLFHELSSFQSERLKYEFLKAEHLADLENIFNQLDLHKLMGKEGFTAPMLAGIFKSLGEKLQELGESGSFNVKEPVTLVYGITRLDNGELIGSATIQTLTAESIARKNDAFKEQENRYGRLFAIGRALAPLAQGIGYGKEACRAIVDNFFRITGDLPMAIISSSFKGNVASGKSAEGCGFEKFSEDKSADGNEYFDMVHYIRAK